MENNNRNESSEQNDSTDKLKFDVAKPVAGIRANKKVTLEIDIEKTLKYLMVAGLAVLIVIYAYKAGIFVYDSFKTMTHSTYQIAVLDMQTLRKDFNRQNQVVDSQQTKTSFENYFKSLMKVYRDRGYLVIDASIAVTFPDNIQIVSYIDLGESLGEVESLPAESK